MVVVCFLEAAAAAAAAAALRAAICLSRAWIWVSFDWLCWVIVAIWLAWLAWRAAISLACVDWKAVSLAVKVESWFSRLVRSELDVSVPEPLP